ncbi:hypothetical protein HH308_16645 [Gordonia sp. TBRC 11910]|uniref:Uncharacterized protein n=1 Tax=Gordonia asplenii TaxID=2725283 RepID=A0A848L2L2_9ACTN|nr:hypothetical protein [Gordonia asplenii]NMO02843.1 hypothetical protein [Gordonia asplenii]
MTLTAILPTLRASIPDPIDLRRWPASTRATVCDIVIGGCSTSSIAAQDGTPCVFDAAASDAAHARSVVITRVSAVVAVDDSMPSYALPELILDADLSRVGADWQVARLIGRASTAKVATFVLAGRSPMVVDLPADVGVGDVLVAPRGPGSTDDGALSAG